MPRNRLFTLIIAMLMTSMGLTVTAQGNLLQNPGFDQSTTYSASGGVENFNFASGWDGWWTNSPSTTEWMNIKPDGYPQTATKRNGDAAQEIGRGGGTFTAAAYQVVNGIAEGTALTASAWVYIDNGPGTDARVRIGIGSNTGGNPLGDVKWSPWVRNVNSWQQVSVDRAVAEGSVTVFIYATQNFPNGPRGTNKVYFDDASLTVTGSGEPEAGSGGGDAPASGPTNTPAPPPTPTQAFAPFVSAQGTVEDGQLVHYVGEGDTLAAISVAYGVPINTLRERNNISGFLMIGQRLVIMDVDDAPTEEPTAEPTEEPAETLVVPAETEETSDVGENSIVQPIPTTATEEAVAEPTEDSVSVAQVTEEPTAEPTEEPTATPDVSPTPTEIPPTPTDAPPAPVVNADDVDPLSTEAAVCVLMFEDDDQNRIQGPGEGLLADGLIELANSAGEDQGSYQTNGADEPFCFEGLEPGSYRAVATAPQGYGLTTPATLFVSVQAGTSFQISFGAAQGVDVAQVPTPDNVVDDDASLVEETAEDDDGSLDLSSIAGFLVLGLAGFVLVGGMIISVIARRL